MIKVYTTGVFDILHKGHLNILAKAKAEGDYLVVGVQDDEGVFKSKGKYPTLSARERMEQLAALPFVDEVLVYNNVDQRPMLEKIQPHVLVQGDDWEKTGDRTLIKEYLTKYNIRLVLIPYTQDISSTKIKKRILSQGERNDRDFILKNLKLLPIEDLKLYEKFHEEKVTKLTEKIQRDNYFFNPITINEHQIVIDGVNRLEALKRLKVKFIPCLMVEYKDVDLRQNIHYKKDGKIFRMSEFGICDGEKIEFPLYSKDDIIRMVRNNEMVENGATWHTVKTAVVRLRVPLAYLMEDFDFQSFLQEIINSGNIRYYPYSTYVCDEWAS